MTQEKTTKIEMDYARNAQAGDIRPHVVSVVIIVAILTLFMVLVAGPAEAAPCNPERNPYCEPVDPPEEPPDPTLPPYVSVDKPSVVVNEGQTATNSGTFYDPADLARGITSDLVNIKASVGTITKSGGYQNGIYSGTWSWSMPTDEWTAVGGDLNRTVTITATDSNEASSSTSFSLTVKDMPPANDSFSSALDLAKVHSGTTTNYTNMATMEVGEPTPSSSTKDCGITGVSNSAWFKFTYGGQGGLPPLLAPNASYNFDTQGSNFDTVLALYEGSSLSTLKQIECSNDNSLPNWNDNLSIPQSKLSVGKTYYVQLTGTGGARSGKYQLHYEPRGLTQPKVMAYNIAEGTTGGGLPAVAQTIKALNPDIVLLNEVREYNSLKLDPPYDIWNQTKYLANQAGIPYFKYEANTITGLTGTKGYAILSRYPISSTNYYEVEACEWYKGVLPNWGILKATIEIDGLTHDVFSTRFSPMHDPSHSAYNECEEPYNRAGHALAMDLVRAVPNDHAVILGGDLNANWSRSWATDFRDNSGLTDVFVERPDPLAGEDVANRADYIYYRGPYSVYQTQHRPSQSLGLPEASDHPYVFAHLLRRSLPQQPDTTITSGPSGNVSATTASFAFSSSEPGSTFECSLDGAPFGACTSPKEYSALANGEHTFEVRAIGTGGTDPTPASRTWTVVDTAAPTANAPTHSFTTLSTLGTSTVPVKLTWSATDNTGGSGIASYQLQQSVNGGAYTDVALPSATTTTISASLAPGTNIYSYRVAAKDNAGNLSAWASGPSFKVTAFQESSTAIVDSGSWTTSALSGAYGGSVQSASALGRNATFTVPAGSKNVEWVSYRGNNRGKAQVWLDGVQQDANPNLTGIQPFDLYSSSVQARKVVFSKAVSPTTSHKLEVRVLAQKNASSSSTRVDIDAFVTTS